MELESYGIYATFLYREFSLIPEGIRAVFKLLPAVCSHGQQTFSMINIKRQIGMMQIIIHWKDMTEAQLFCIEHFPQILTV